MACDFDSCTCATHEPVPTEAIEQANEKLVDLLDDKDKDNAVRNQDTDVPEFPEIINNITSEFNIIVNITIPDVNITIPEIPEVNITIPDVNITIPDVNITIPDVNITIPDVNITIPTPNTTVTINTTRVDNILDVFNETVQVINEFLLEFFKVVGVEPLYKFCHITDGNFTICDSLCALSEETCASDICYCVENYGAGVCPFYAYEACAISCYNARYLCTEEN